MAHQCSSLATSYPPRCKKLVLNTPIFKKQNKPTTTTPPSCLPQPGQTCSTWKDSHLFHSVSLSFATVFLNQIPLYIPLLLTVVANLCGSATLAVSTRNFLLPDTQDESNDSSHTQLHLPPSSRAAGIQQRRTHREFHPDAWRSAELRKSS